MENDKVEDYLILGYQSHETKVNLNIVNTYMYNIYSKIIPIWQAYGYKT